MAHSKIQKVLRLTQRNLHCENDGFEIIRPCHQVLNRQNWRLFFKPNSFCSQTPFGYLNIYKNTNLTITDRLHASVATMAYGNPARLFLKSNRAFLLDRVGAADVSNRVFQLDMDYLSEEKAKYLAWMSAALA